MDRADKTAVPYSIDDDVPMHSSSNLRSSSSSYAFAPWSDSQVSNLAAHQARGDGYEYVCVDKYYHPGNPILVASRQGWTCPQCGEKSYVACRRDADATSPVANVVPAGD